MKSGVNRRLDREFKPVPEFKLLNFIQLELVILFLILPWFIPAMVFPPKIVSIIIFFSVLATMLFIAYWIPKYCNSISYKLTGSEMVWKRGVWFKTTGIVPYNRITNVDIAQGPISRMLGIAALKIQTAGYSAQKMGAEIKIEGVKDFEELRAIITGFVRGRKPVAVEAFEEENTDARILTELVKIRKLLEKRKK